MTCPVCLRSLTRGCIANRVGKPVCLEPQNSSVRAERMDASRRAKREYDRLYAKARRGTLRELAMRVVNGAMGAAPAVAVAVSAQFMQPQQASR